MQDLGSSWASNIPKFVVLALSRHDGRDHKHEKGKNLFELHFVSIIHVDPWKCCERGVWKGMTMASQRMGPDVAEKRRQGPVHMVQSLYIRVVWPSGPEWWDAPSNSRSLATLVWFRPCLIWTCDPESACRSSRSCGRGSKCGCSCGRDKSSCRTCVGILYIPCSCRRNSETCSGRKPLP